MKTALHSFLCRVRSAVARPFVILAGAISAARRPVYGNLGNWNAYRHLPPALRWEYLKARHAARKAIKP